MRINETDTVMIIAEVGFLSTFRGQKGVVSRVYPVSRDEGVAVVSMDSGETLKVRFDDLVKITVPESKPAEPVEPEIPEGAKKIFKADFMRFIGGIVGKADDIREIVRSIAIGMAGSKICEKIFSDQDAVVMTEEEFISALWGASNPVFVSETVGGKMTARKTWSISLAAFSELRDFIPIVFGESEND